MSELKIKTSDADGGATMTVTVSVTMPIGGMTESRIRDADMTQEMTRDTIPSEVDERPNYDMRINRAADDATGMEIIERDDGDGGYTDYVTRVFYDGATLIMPPKTVAPARPLEQATERP